MAFKLFRTLKKMLSYQCTASAVTPHRSAITASDCPTSSLASNSPPLRRVVHVDLVGHGHDHAVVVVGDHHRGLRRIALGPERDGGQYKGVPAVLAQIPALEDFAGRQPPPVQLPEGIAIATVRLHHALQGSRPGVAEEG